MKSVSLDLIQAFVIFAESSNIVEAARKLGLSQPAVSIQLKKLEASLPHPAFAYQGRRKVLTRYGKKLYRSMKKSLAGLDLSFERVNRMFSNPENVELRIGARKEVFHRVASMIRFPGTIRFFSLSTERAIAQLKRNTIDLAISHQVPDSADIIAREIFANRVRFVVHRKWLGKRSISMAIPRDPEFLKGTPCLVYREDPPFLREWTVHTGVDLGDIRIRCVCEDWSAIMRMVEQGLGFSFVPEDIEILSAGVEQLLIPPELIRKVTYYALFHREMREIPAFRDFLSLSGVGLKGD